MADARVPVALPPARHPSPPSHLVRGRGMTGRGQGDRGKVFRGESRKTTVSHLLDFRLGPDETGTVPAVFGAERGKHYLEVTQPPLVADDLEQHRISGFPGLV